MLKALDTPVALPEVARSVNPCWPKFTERSGKDAAPLVMVVCESVPLSAAAMHGGVALKFITTLALGAPVLSVTCTVTGLPESTCPPTVFSGSVTNVTAAAVCVTPPTVIVKLCVVTCGGFELSVMRIVKLEVPAPVGVPEITPPLKVSPAGSVPEEMEKVKGPTPPVVVTVWLYGAPGVAGASTGGVVITRGAAIRMESCCVAVFCGNRAEPTSWACTVKVVAPGVVGTPVIDPVVAFKVSPAGNAPAVIENVWEVGFPPCVVIDAA